MPRRLPRLRGRLIVYDTTTTSSPPPVLQVLGGNDHKRWGREQVSQNREDAQPSARFAILPAPTLRGGVRHRPTVAGVRSADVPIEGAAGAVGPAPLVRRVGRLDVRRRGRSGPRGVARASARRNEAGSAAADAGVDGVIRGALVVPSRERRGRRRYVGVRGVAGKCPAPCSSLIFSSVLTA